MVNCLHWNLNCCGDPAVSLIVIHSHYPLYYPTTISILSVNKDSHVNIYYFLKAE